MKGRRHSIVLIGFMGTGKSSVARRLAEMLGWPVVDTDAMIEETLGRSISEIFEQLGEERFREEEAAVLEKLDPERASIIVTGGGAVLRPRNVRRLRELGRVVCLTAKPSILCDRLRHGTNRPLLAKGDLATQIKSLLQERASFYQGAADLTLDTSFLTHDEVADQIRKSLALAG
jgi:shikimate kinase